MEIFKIDLNKKIDSERMREIFQIRHLVVHNVGKVDQTFLNKLKTSKWGIKYDINKEVVINETLFSKLLSYIEKAVALNPDHKGFRKALQQVRHAVSRKGTARAPVKP